MRLEQCVPCVLLLGFIGGCGSDSDDDSANSSTTGANTTGANTTGANTTGAGTTGASTTGANTTSGTSNTTSSSSSSTTGGASNLPADGSAASIAAFLEAEGYKDTGWVSAYETPNPQQQGSVHGTVMVYLSPALVAFRQANTNPLDEPAVAGSMAVKEFYDETSSVVGKAVTFYPAGPDVVYYCYGAEGRCAQGSPATTLENALWGDEDGDAVEQCDNCHGGNVYTELPN